MYSRFDCKVERDDKKTSITVTNCNYETALLLLGKFRRKFGNWSTPTEIKLWGPNQLINATVSLSVTIPASTNPRHTRDPFTKEFVSGYLAGLREFLEKANTKAIAECITEDL